MIQEGLEMTKGVLATSEMIVVVPCEALCVIVLEMDRGMGLVRVA